MGQILLSVPPHLRDFIHSAAGREVWSARLTDLAGGADVFVGTDPRQRRLGSGGGTVNLLTQAWRDRKGRRRARMADWLPATQRLVLHAGGESRRLPAYAALGKAFLPMPAVDGLTPRRFDQMLADFQIPAYEQVLKEAGPKAAVLVTSGDVWLDFDPLQIPEATADITGIGMRVSPEVARHFGVYFVAKERSPVGEGERPIAFFRQKPSAEEIYRHSARYDSFVDTGMWLLSLEALQFLFRRCGWNEANQSFGTRDGHPSHLDLYTEIGAALGVQTPAPANLRRLGWARLKTAVIPLEEANFYHLGSSRQLFESFEQIQRGRLSPQKTLSAATPPSAFTNLSSLPVWLDSVQGGSLAGEAAGLAPGHPSSLRSAATGRPSLQLDGHNVVTGLPQEARLTHLGQSWCVEASPIGRDQWVLRPYHLDDSLRGTPGQGAKLCGQDARAWLAARGLPAPETDVYQLSLYPVLPAAAIEQPLLNWFFAHQPDPEVTARVAARRRLSAAEIPETVDFKRFFAQRRAAQAQVLQAEFADCLDRADTRVFAHDFAAIADYARREAPALRRWLRQHADDILAKINRPEHAARFLMLLAEFETGPKRAALVEAGYRRLQESVIASNRIEESQPRRTLKDDQIVWARSPVRLDLAGGWTDTPPYCFEHGGSVLNVAVLLNGQPPIQAFVRSIPEYRFRLRSIDLGSAEDVESYAALASFRDPKGRFSLPKAALALAGFHPNFLLGKAPGSLRAQLKAFGGGLEISLLSAVPKGSGLGTSSILGATLLGALNRACGLGWDEVDLYQRVLGVEQLLTTGGGWQDQAGALFRSVKLIQTQPGLGQTPTVRYLPEYLLGESFANQTLLLYYTGVTRLAKGILKEIVHDMFLGRTGTLRTLNLIRANSLHLHRAMQEGDPVALRRCIARSWNLNQRLDPGTTTAEIKRVIATSGPDLAACKLLGAGGGGYMLLCAADATAGRRIRERLEGRPPNARARFIDFQVADHAVEVTVS